MPAPAMRSTEIIILARDAKCLREGITFFVQVFAFWLSERLSIHTCRYIFFIEDDVVRGGFARSPCNFVALADLDTLGNESKETSVIAGSYFGCPGGQCCSTNSTCQCFPPAAISGAVSVGRECTAL